VKYIIAFLLTVAISFQAIAADITPNGVRQGDLVKVLYEVGDSGLQRAFNSGGLAEGTDTGEIQITTAVQITSGAKFETIGTFDVALAATPAEAVPTGSTCYYLITYDGDNDTTEVYKGRANIDTLATISYGENNVVYGGLKIVNTSGSDFTLGTTDLGDVGITETFYNLSCKPYSVTVSTK